VLLLSYTKTHMMGLLTTTFSPLTYTLIGVGVVLFFVLRGLFRGVFRELFSVLSLLGTYPLATPFAWMVKPAIPLDRFPSLFHEPLLAAIGGTVAYFFLCILFFIITRYFELHRKWEGRMRLIVRVGGAVIGGLFGGLIVLLIGWFILTAGTVIESLHLPVAHRPAAIIAEESGEEVEPEQTKEFGIDSEHVEGLGTESEEAVEEEGDESVEEPQQEGGGEKVSEEEGVFVSEYDSAEPVPFSLQFITAHADTLRESSIGKIAESTNPVTESYGTEITIAKEILENPEKAKKLFEEGPMAEIMQEQAVQDVLKNPEVQELAQEGDIMGLLQHPAIVELLNDPVMKAELEKINAEDIQKLLEGSTTPAAGDQ